MLAVACRRWKTLPVDHAPYAIESGLTLVALVGLLDPPRDEARAAVQTCLSAGIRPVMITGDHPVTARAIARQVGILSDDGKVLTGRDLQVLSDAELRAEVGEIRVYARVDPAQKIRIVTALQNAGEIVAMTGDGVNDAPALARAEIGVAMGKVGTDVAREAASLVLLDDDFATIVAAVREGRRIYDNIRKFVRFVVTCNSAEIWTIFLAPFLGLPLPMMPIQILWMNITRPRTGRGTRGERCHAPAAAAVSRRPVRAWDRISTLRAEGDLRPWLFTIMHNVFATRWRRTKRRADLMPEDAEAEPTVAPNQEANAEIRDVLRGLATLPEEQRQVILLVAVEGFRYEDVADMLGVPIGTIMSRLSSCARPARAVRAGT